MFHDSVGILCLEPLLLLGLLLDGGEQEIPVVLEGGIVLERLPKQDSDLCGMRRHYVYDKFVQARSAELDSPNLVLEFCGKPSL